MPPPKEKDGADGRRERGCSPSMLLVVMLESGRCEVESGEPCDRGRSDDCDLGRAICRGGPGHDCRGVDVQKQP
eukprot:scaffold25772_cov136-Isochrysis_galbana.AAC.2